jgi:hypothetical protein
MYVPVTPVSSDDCRLLAQPWCTGMDTRFAGGIPIDARLDGAGVEQGCERVTV